MGTVPTKRAILRFSGIFDFDGLYAAIIDWAKNYNFMWHEVDYKHKVPNPSGAEQEWKWLLTKEVTEYYAYEILFTVHSYDLQEVSVEVDGKTRTLTKGRIYMFIDGKIITDYAKKFSGSKFKEWMGKYYAKAYDPETSDQWDKLHYRILNLHAILKKYFEMQTQKHPYKGYLREN